MPAQKSVQYPTSEPPVNWRQSGTVHWVLAVQSAPSPRPSLGPHAPTIAPSISVTLQANPSGQVGPGAQRRVQYGVAVDVAQNPSGHCSFA